MDKFEVLIECDGKELKVNGKCTYAEYLTAITFSVHSIGEKVGIPPLEIIKDLTRGVQFIPGKEEANEH